MVLSNHVHGIIWIVEIGTESAPSGIIEDQSIKEGAHRAPQPDRPPQPSIVIVGADGIRPGGIRPGFIRPGGIHPDNIHPDNIHPNGILQRKPKSLGSFLAGFKASVTSRAKKELNITSIWQHNYYEHIIRTEVEFKKIWAYIENNPHKWQEDSLEPSAPPNKFKQE